MPGTFTAVRGASAAEGGVVSWGLTLKQTYPMPQRVIVEQFSVSGGTADTNFEPRPQGKLATALAEGWEIASSSSSAVQYPNGNVIVYGTFVLQKTDVKPFYASKL